MIEPKQGDVGRKVTYIGNRHYGGPLEYGTVRTWNEKFVFVVYHGAIHARATRREDLEWTETRP